MASDPKSARGGRARSRREPGISDVAAAAGVSVGTVSHVLNRPEVVALRTRERIERVMLELGFVPDLSARRLRLGMGRVIGVQVLDIANPFWGEVVRGVEESARAAGYVIMVFSSSESAEIEARNLDLLRLHRVDGLLIAPVATDERRLREIDARGTPVVLLDHRSERGRLPAVTVDDVLGGVMAAEYLRGRGHERIAFVTGPLDIAAYRDRRAGVRSVLRRRQRQCEEVVEVRVAGLNAREGAAAVQRLLSRDPRPTAVLCANDLLALGVLRGLTERGVRVPEDVSLIGYDDLDFSAMLSPALTTIRQHPFRIGQSAGELLIARLTDPDLSAPRQLLFEPELVVRASA
ncbi:MAG: LacI family DNA-binding transcriptional regulator [Solirubrobacterales bacterium]|nr:LacI family DNA-binding transcriptional regulator [Solirubrobacterales bacterium]